MNHNGKLILAAAAAALAATTWAGARDSGFGARSSGFGARDEGRGMTMQRSEFRRSAFSSPNDPFHDTYRKNTGQIRTEAPKPVRNIPAKISAARKADLNFELRRERAFQSPISCYSNYETVSTVARTAPAAPSGGGANDAASAQRSITINNSNVVINQ